MTTTASEQLEELVAQAAQGDRQAQEVLLQRFWPVIRYAVRARRARLGPTLRDETVDLEQQAALRVLTELERQQWQGKSAFASWVAKLATLEVIDRYRYHRAGKRDAAADATAQEAVMPAPALGSAETLMDNQRRLERILDHLDELEPRQAAALLMHHMGFSHGDIGDTLECSADAARKLVSRARTRLVKLLD